jgi:hypothetical protein
MEYSLKAHEAEGAPPSKLREVANMYSHLDNLLGGMRLNQLGGFDGPESSLGEVMTSADFNYALGTFIQRQLEPGYTRKRFAFEPLVKPVTNPNFMTVTRLQDRSTTVDELEYVGEKGEARPGMRRDAVPREYRVYRREKQFDFSMESLVNDELGYLSDQAARMGVAARVTLEKFVHRMLFNATTLARLVGLGALYSSASRLATTSISEARMAFNQRTDPYGEPIMASLNYIVHHSGLVDTVATIQRSTQVPEDATNAANVVAGTFVPIEDPYLAGTAPNLPWMAVNDPTGMDNIVAFILARWQDLPAPVLARKRSDMESFVSFAGAGTPLPPAWGDFATGNVVVKAMDAWGTYADDTEGNLYDYRGAFYSTGTAAP